MKNNQISASEALRIRRIYLENKSDALKDALEKEVNYLQDNVGSLVGESIVDGVTAKLPPFLRNLINRNDVRQDQEEGDYDFEEMDFSNKGSYQGNVLSYIDKALDMTPFFIKGFKGIAISFILKKLVSNLFKK